MILAADSSVAIIASFVGFLTGITALDAKNLKNGTILKLNNFYAGFQYFIDQWIGNIKIRFSEGMRFNPRIKLLSQFH
jgi:hypothetical protein